MLQGKARDLLPMGEGGRRSRPDEGLRSHKADPNPSPGASGATLSLWERVFADPLISSQPYRKTAAILPPSTVVTSAVVRSAKA